jgi:hypothetical protein
LQGAVAEQRQFEFPRHSGVWTDWTHL